MKTITLTFIASSLFMGILFFTYQENESQMNKSKGNLATHAIAVALGAPALSPLSQAISSEQDTVVQSAQRE